MNEPITSAVESQPRAKRKRNAKKPAKPYAEFPLFPHDCGLWAKKIKSQLYYFGPWARRVDGKLKRVQGDGWEAALEMYKAQAADLHAGRTPRERQEGITVDELVNKFLAAKNVKLGDGKLSQHTFRDYIRTCRYIVDVLGRPTLVKDLAPEDGIKLMRVSTKWGPVATGNFVNQVSVVFRWGFKTWRKKGFEIPDFGPEFVRPSKKELRLARARKGPRMFEADELRKILDAATQPLRAMILLGINCGLGNADCGRLPFAALDLEGGWLNYHREKTGIPRRAKLWPETVAAIREAIAQRPKPKQDGLEDRVFVTVRGGSWFKDTGDNPVSKEMAKLLKKLNINGERNFYCLRHGCETIGGESRDQPAVDHVMGHARDDMASVYRERISDERLVAVAEYVRRWLFGE